jgi:NodT family efflux transporter outer membrane factor (OMF) lipoprotein
MNKQPSQFLLSNLFSKSPRLCVHSSLFGSWRFGVLAFASLLASGCTVGPDYQPPHVTVSTNFNELDASTSAIPATQPSAMNARAEPIVEWWSTLRDPTLSSLVERAARQNLSLQQATSRVRQARADLVIAGGRLLPTVNSSAGYAVSRGSENITLPFGGGSGSGTGGSGNTPSILRQQSGNGGGNGASQTTARGGPASPLGEGGLPGTQTELYQIGLDATWEIDLFGGVRRGVEAAGADLAASVEDRRSVLTSLLAEVARDYLQLRGLQQRLVIARANLRTQQETLDLTLSRFRSGFVTELDVSRARTQVAQTQSAIPPLEGQTRQMIHALSTLIGQQPAALSDELKAVAPLPSAPPDVPVGLPSSLLARRPDIRRAEQQIRAANARVGVATADLFPKFAITGGAGLDSSHAKNLFSWDSRYFILSPGVSWNLFDGGRIRANIQAQTEQRQQLMLAYQDRVLKALQETEDAIVVYATEQARHAALVDAEKAARASVDIARDQYKQGVVDFLTVLDTQRELLTAQDQLVQSDQLTATNLVALYKALGGGWEIESAREVSAN